MSVEMDDYKNHSILSLNKAAELISKLKSENKKIGLCHGGFDLLHAGHVKHFESSSKICDVLFVSITSDKYVETRKGKGRPIYHEKLRAYMVACIEFVDYVVISDFKTGIEVIEYLKPNYYIKGPDYTNSNTKGLIAEKDAIERVGGEIKYTNDPKLSTTEIINGIKSNDN